MEDRCTPATFTVNVTTDTVDADPNVTSLREAITAANKAGGATQHTIDFAAAIHNKGIALQSALPAITANVLVDGPGRDKMSVMRGTLDTQFRLFQVNSGSTTTIARLTLAKGDVSGTDGDGGAILSSGDLTVTDCDIRNNKAAIGGAIRAASGKLTVTNCHVAQNQATASGGGVAAGVDVPVTVTGGKFEQNGAGNSGGAICVGGTLGAVAPAVTVSGVEISNNAAALRGGGIAAVGKTNLTLTGGTDIHHNSVTSTTQTTKGGGVYITAGTLTYDGVRIADNNAGVGDGVYYVIDQGAVTLATGPGGKKFEGKPVADQEVGGYSY